MHLTYHHAISSSHLLRVPTISPSSVSVAYLIRPNRRTLDWLAHQRETYFPGHFGSKNDSDNKGVKTSDDNEGILSIYIRHGDKGSEMKLVDAIVYMNTAVDMFDKGLVIAANDKPQIPGMQSQPLPNNANTDVNTSSRRRLTIAVPAQKGKNEEQSQSRSQTKSYPRGDIRLLGELSLDNNNGTTSSNITISSNFSSSGNNVTDTGAGSDSSSVPPSSAPITSTPSNPEPIAKRRVIFFGIHHTLTNPKSL